MFGKKITAAAVAAFASIAAMADGVTTVSGEATGVWMESFATATNFASRTATPLVIFWANTGCTRCQALEAAVEADDFKQWMDSTPYAYCFVLGKDKKDTGINEGSGAKEFAQTAGGTIKKLTSFPFICLYWPKSDGSASFKAYSGGMTSAQLKKFITTAFDSYVAVPDYIGGDLAFTNRNDYARMEAEAGFTKYVDVPLFRAANTSRFAATNIIRATSAGDTIASDDIIWAIGETQRTWRVDVSSRKSGEVVEIVLFDNTLAKRGDSAIYVTPSQENSPDNPLFPGERTKDTLAYGEWTMDLDAAMAKYKADASAHILAMASGSRWCPDCAMTDTHMLSSPQFKKWALDNKVILVDIDVPNFGPSEAASACLLTRTVSRTSDGYISCRGTAATNEAKRIQSGMGYLTRHMVDDKTARALLERNRSLVGRNTLQGGWNNPGRANQYRTGIPNFFALDRSGNLAATFETFSDLGPKEFKDEYLYRFTELISAEDDGANVASRAWQTTTESADSTDETAGTFNALNLKKVYKLSAPESAARQTFTLEGDTTGVTATVNIIAVQNGEASTVATSKGSLSEGISVEGAIVSGGEYYIEVVADGKGALAADSASLGFAAPFSLAGSREKIENPFINEWTKTAAYATLPLFSDGELEGTLALTLKKTGKITAKWHNGGKTIASFSGAWDKNIAIDGTATAALTKKTCSLSLEIDQDGRVSAIASDGANTLFSGPCGISTDYSAFAGRYTAILQRDNGASAVMTLYSSGSSAKKNGKFSYVLYLPDGKKLSGTTGITWNDANFGILPIAKSNSTERFSAALLIRRDAAKAPTPRAIISANGVETSWSSAYSGDMASFHVFGSYHDSTADITDGVEGETLGFHIPSGVETEAYGVITNAPGDGARIAISGNKLAKTQTVKGWSFTYKKQTGLFTGKCKLAAEGKKSLSASYTGAIAPGWFSDCDCGEDDDTLIERENKPYGSGFAVYSDKTSTGGSRAKTIKRSIPVEIK